MSHDPLRPETDSLKVNLSLPSASHYDRMQAVKSTLLNNGVAHKPRYPWDKDKLTPVIHSNLITAIKSGMTLTAACKLTGISPNSIKKWLRAVDNGGIDESTNFKATGAHYKLYSDLMLAEAQNEQRNIDMIQRLGHGGVENETDVIEREIIEPNGNIVKERIVKKAVLPPSLTALTWFTERRHRDWHGKRQVQPGMEGINKDNVSPVEAEGDYGEVVGNGMPPLIIQVSNSASVNNNIPANAQAESAKGLPITVPRDMQFHGMGRISKTPLPGAAAIPGAGLADRIIDNSFNPPRMSGTASDGYLEVNNNANESDNNIDSATEHARKGGRGSVYNASAGEEKESAQSPSPSPTPTVRSPADIMRDLINRKAQARNSNNNNNDNNNNNNDN
jgi:hypothetical protein